jgi:hypothetical protein
MLNCDLYFGDDKPKKLSEKMTMSDILNEFLLTLSFKKATDKFKIKKGTVLATEKCLAY